MKVAGRKLPSFLDGMARVLDIGGNFDPPRPRLPPEIADALAIASDWEAVANDLRNAARAYSSDDE